VSYSVITPSACQGITDSIFFKPEIRWEIVRIAVLRPWWVDGNYEYPSTTFIKRNELKAAPSIRSIIQDIKKGRSPRIVASECRTQRGCLMLKNVAYLITVRPRMINDGDPRKYYHMLIERLKRGQFFRKPYFGCREFACDVRLATADDEARVMVDLDLTCGFMLHHLEYDQYPPVPVWFNGEIKRGVMDCDPLQVELFR
jgi:CRISPR-associated protein Cas5d